MDTKNADADDITDNHDIAASIVPGCRLLQPKTTRKKPRGRRSGAIKRFGLRLAGRKDGFGGDVVVDANGKQRRVSASTLEQLRHPQRTRTTTMNAKAKAKKAAAVAAYWETVEALRQADEARRAELGPDWEDVYIAVEDGKEHGRTVYRLEWVGVERRNQ